METIKRIKELCEKKGITVKGLEIELEEPLSSIAKANSNMKAEKLYKIAEYFQVSMESIIGKEDIKPAAGYPISDFEYEIIKAFRGSEFQDAVLNLLGLEKAGEENKKSSSFVS